MRLIKFTMFDGRQAYINVDNVSAVASARPLEIGSHAVLFIGAVPFEVKETVLEVMEKIEHETDSETQQ